MKSCKGLLAIALVALAGSAFATPGGEGNNTNCNGQGNPNSPCTGSVGGTGGAGGTGVGIAGAAALAVAQANAAAVAAQQQGQRQSNRSTNDNRSNAVANGGVADSHANGGSGGDSSNQVTVGGDVTNVPRQPVATAYAAPLVSTNGTCMGSTSAGGQGAAFGFSIGSTWTDNNCDIRYDAEALRAAGLPGAAQARLCQKAEIAQAMKAAGTPCPGAGSAAVVGPVKAADSAPIMNGPNLSDPFIRKLNGLPPL